MKHPLQRCGTGKTTCFDDSAADTRDMLKFASEFELPDKSVYTGEIKIEDNGERKVIHGKGKLKC